MNLAFLSSRYYLKFGLDRDPFPPNSTPKKLFLTHDLSRLLSELSSAIKTQTETLVLESAPGTGKSVLAEYLTHIKEPNWHVSLIRGSDEIDKTALAHAIISQHFPGHRFDKTRSGSILQEFLQLYQINGKLPVVIIDDAHLLPAETLKFVLEIANLRYEEAQYRIVLFADLSLVKRLELPSLKEIISGQREYKRIPSFSKPQTVKYLEHRLSLAGQCKVVPFNSDDIDNIFKNSAGIPGEIHKFAKQHMQNFVIPGRTKKILVRSAASITAGVFMLVAAYANMSGDKRDATMTQAAVSIALELPDTSMEAVVTKEKKLLTELAKEKVVVSNRKDRNKVPRVISQIAPEQSNKDVLRADMKRQADIQARKIAEEKAKMEIRYQLAAYDRLALRISDVVQN
jgi:type II secretory pathway predicted ATPase ExeA